jgi:hypothetical protein
LRRIAIIRGPWLVCHGNVIRWLVAKALGMDQKTWTKMDIANASLTVINIRADGSTHLAMFNDVGHSPVEKQSWAGVGGGGGKGDGATLLASSRPLGLDQFQSFAMPPLRDFPLMAVGRCLWCERPASRRRVGGYPAMLESCSRLRGRPDRQQRYRIRD